MFKLRSKPAETAVAEPVSIPNQRRYATTPQIDAALVERGKVRSLAVKLHFLSVPLLFSVPEAMYAMGWANRDLSNGALVTACIVASMVVWNGTVVKVKNLMVRNGVDESLAGDALSARVAQDFLVPEATVQEAIARIVTGDAYGDSEKNTVEFVYDGRRVIISMSEGVGRQINSTTTFLTVQCLKHRSVNDRLVTV